MTNSRYKEVICKTLDDGRISYFCSQEVRWAEDGWGTCYYRTTVAVPAGTSFDDAAALSEAFQLSDEEIGSRRDGMHIDFSDRQGRRVFAHNVYTFGDGSEAVGVVHHPRRGEGSS